MPQYKIDRVYKLEDVPEFKRFQQANPGKRLSASQTALMYGRAIHWMSILDVLWPDFEDSERNEYFFEVAYVVCNDPDDEMLPPEFYQYIARAIATFWRIQLDALYPNGNWEVEIWPDPEITVHAVIHSRKP